VEIQGAKSGITRKKQANHVQHEKYTEKYANIILKIFMVIKIAMSDLTSLDLMRSNWYDMGLDSL